MPMTTHHVKLLAMAEEARCMVDSDVLEEGLTLTCRRAILWKMHDRCTVKAIILVNLVTLETLTRSIPNVRWKETIGPFPSRRQGPTNTSLVCRMTRNRPRRWK